MDNTILVGIAELRTGVDAKQPLEERLKVAMRAALHHWAVIDEDSQFKAAVGAVMAEATEEERDRMNIDIKFLGAMSSAMSGGPVDFARVAEELKGKEDKAVGLRKLWMDVKAEKEQQAQV